MNVITLEGLLPADYLVLSAPNDDEAVLAAAPEELALVTKAIDKRRRELATGRYLAREAMVRLGHDPVAIPSADDRAPIWPHGLTGSISHCDTRAVVAVGPRLAGTVGVDVEHRAELKRELWKSVFLPEEIGRLENDWTTAERGRMALVLFSAKEALYKAQYPRTTTYMGFSELEVELEPEGARGGGVRCTFQNVVGSFEAGAVALGRYALDAFPDGEVVTAVHIG